jgi:hypothetical protein
LLESNEEIIDHAMGFYKKLFAEENRSSVRLAGRFWEGEKITDEENAALEADFSEQEVKAAIFESYAEGAPGLDGFSFLLYQKFWPLIKGDLMKHVQGFSRGEINIARLNYTMITLIPKEGARNLKKFRPISLINCSFKIFAKALNNILVLICDRLLSCNQTVFVKGMFILESVVSAHEIIHDVVRGGEKAVVLKLDYEKAYDRVSWHFLEEMLYTRGFGKKWISWIMSLVKEGSIAIRLNDVKSPYFQPGKGLTQGDPLSPLLFNSIADVFTRLLSKAACRGYITGLMTKLYLEGVISLQYAGDTLLFLDNDVQGACHLKWLMACFEYLSGMKINYHKSDMIAINLKEGETTQFARVICCKLGTFPSKYLGVPLHHDKLRKKDIQPVVDTVINRIPGWKGRLLSYRARLTLLKACLASISIYLMSVTKFPKWAIEIINSYMANFFWDDQEDKHRYHLANWQSLC